MTFYEGINLGGLKRGEELDNICNLALALFREDVEVDLRFVPVEPSVLEMKHPEKHDPGIGPTEEGFTINGHQKSFSRFNLRPDQVEPMKVLPGVSNVVQKPVRPIDGHAVAAHLDRFDHLISVCNARAPRLYSAAVRHVDQLLRVIR